MKTDPKTRKLIKQINRTARRRRHGGVDHATMAALISADQRCTGRTRSDQQCYVLRDTTGNC